MKREDLNKAFQKISDNACKKYSDLDTTPSIDILKSIIIQMNEAVEKEKKEWKKVYYAEDLKRNNEGRKIPYAIFDTIRELQSKFKSILEDGK